MLVLCWLWWRCPSPRSTLYLSMWLSCLKASAPLIWRTDKGPHRSCSTDTVSPQNNNNKNECKCSFVLPEFLAFRVAVTVIINNPLWQNVSRGAAACWVVYVLYLWIPHFVLNCLPQLFTQLLYIKQKRRQNNILGYLLPLAYCRALYWNKLPWTAIKLVCMT